MCGIVGLFSEEDIALSTLKKMTDAIYHRGPDDEGYCVLGNHIKTENALKNFYEDTHQSPINIGLGHRRLTIIDLSTEARQPMSLNDRYWMIFNGEIFNYIEIKEELKTHGYTFNTTSDTEVLLAAYDFWKEDMLPKLNGMWAFIIYDKTSQNVLISRDRFGIKPLHYAKTKQGIAFASEIKALLNHPDIDPKVNQSYIQHYIKHGPIEYKTITAFDDIFRFPHNHFVSCHISELIKDLPQPKTYWHAPLGPIQEPFSEEKMETYAKKYAELLNDSIKLRLRSDVKVGSALSGGLDSTSIVYLMNQQLKATHTEKSQQTFSTVYTKTPGAEHCDESTFINELTHKLGVTSHKIEPKAEDIPEEHRHMIYALDTPPANTCMSGWHTFKKVTQTDVKVTLDGQGADESLAGYISYIPSYLSSLTQNLHKEAQALKNIEGTHTYIKLGKLYNYLPFNWIKKLADKCLIKLGKNIQPGIPINQALQTDMQSRLTNLLHYLDRTSMYFSLESRLPFLDYRLVETILKTPANYKFHNGWTKYISRHAMNKKLPDNIVWRKDKMGWPIPEELWFKGPLKPWIIDTINKSEFIKKIAPKFSIKKALSKNKISLSIRYLNLAIWYELYFEKAAYKDWNHAKNNY